ncbi:MAG TPA: hypothetical protein VF916_15745 [Ktedonobacterales bacterium]
MTHSRLTLLGHVMRHAIGVLLLCWRRAVRAGAIAGVVGAAAVEIGAVLSTHRFPPDGVAQLVAVTLGAALAFGVAVTVITDELVIGIIDAIRLLLGEAEAGVRVARAASQRTVGEANWRLLGLIGLGGLAAPHVLQPRERLATAPAPAPLRPGAAPTSETLAGVAAADADTQPLWQPVPAAQLPRIPWIAEEAAATAPGSSRVSDEQPFTALYGTAAPITRPLDQSAEPSDAPPAGTTASAGLAEPLVWHADDAPAPTAGSWHDPLQAAEPEQEEAGIVPVDLFGAPPPSPNTRPLDTATRPPGSVTRPLPERTRPLSQSELPGIPRSSVWEHISQVLAGRPVPPMPPEADEASAETTARDDTPTPNVGS